MIYVFDSNVLINLFRSYYRSRFPSLWRMFDECVAEGQITSVREVYNEISRRDDELAEWCKQNKNLFSSPSYGEMQFIVEVFQYQHFQAIIRKQERLSGKPVADPFVIAKAKIIDGCVVTEEKFTKNAAKIPNICKHFKVRYMNLEQFMDIENWVF